jgi:phytoene/squalene synthetase
MEAVAASASLATPTQGHDGFAGVSAFSAAAGWLLAAILSRVATPVGIREIELDEAREQLEKPDAPLLLDVRTDRERGVSYIPGSVHLPMAEVEARIAELTRTQRHLQGLARRAAAQDPADCRGYCSIITG